MTRKEKINLLTDLHAGRKHIWEVALPPIIIWQTVEDQPGMIRQGNTMIKATELSEWHKAKKYPPGTVYIGKGIGTIICK